MFKILLWVGIPLAAGYMVIPQFRAVIAGLAPFALAAACPLAMLFGMKGMTSMNSCKEHFVCSECGLTYREETFAKACKCWCREHTSCNLEIIKHAVKN